MDDTISRQDAIKAVTYGALSSATLFGRSDAGMTALRDTVRAINSLPSAQPETHEKRTETHARDLIDRQAAIDALGERPIVWDEWTDEYSLGQRNQYDDDKSAIEALPSATPECKQECMPMYANVCDTISRQAAIDALNKKKIYRPLDSDRYVISDCLNEIVNLPSAQPEIIRCRECKHYYYADNRIPQEQMYVCDLDGDRWSPDSYCSFAERKEDAFNSRNKTC